MDEYRKYEPIFGSWYLSKLLGKGSFGKVYEITREEYGTTYRSALKIISIPQDQDDVRSRMADGTDMSTVSEYYDDVLREIINENEIMAQLKGNSNIVSYEDHQIIPHDDGIGYDILIRMELLTPLVEWIMNNDLDERIVVKLGIDICKALELCHKKNIIHRDIKPQNIFMSQNGDFKLGDFGIARTIERTTGEMSQKGTYNYMAPEVFKGEPYDATVDIYSLGIVLYTLLNGNRGPFLPVPPEKVTYKDEEMARTRRLRGDALPNPRNADIMLSRIISKACSYRPSDRYQNAEQMRIALEGYADTYESMSDKTALLPHNRIRTASIPVAAAQPAMETFSDQETERLSSIPAIPSIPVVPQPDVRSTDRPSRRYMIPIIAGVAALAILVIAGLALLLRPEKTNVDIAELLVTPAFTGYNGQGVLSSEIAVDETKMEAVLDSFGDEGKKEIARAFLNSIEYQTDKIEGLSNDDVLEVRTDYNSTLADEAGIQVRNDTFTITVSDLKEAPDYLSGAKELHGHFYKLFDEPMYWTEARAACESMGGHLVTVLDEEEENFIEELVESSGTLYHYWLGATDEEHEGIWRWVTGEDVPMIEDNWGYQKWCGNQPNNIEAYEDVGQDYMELQATRGDQGLEEYMTWTDIGNSGEAGERFYGPPDYNETKYYGYICEWDGQ